MVGWGVGGVGGYIRRLSRDPGYGLRGKKRNYGKGDTRPLGPKLIRGRGLRRRRNVISPALGLTILALAAIVGVIVIRLLRVAT